MGLFFRPRRLLARLAAGAAPAGIAYDAGSWRAQQDEYGDDAEAAYAASRYTPPPVAPAAQYATPSAQHAAPAPAPMTREDHGTVLCQVLQAAIVGDPATVERFVTDDVTCWSPSMVVGSRAELTEMLSMPEEALSPVVLSVDSLDVLGDRAIVEWRVEAVFSGPFLLDDDLLIEPTGRPVALAGMTVAEFRDGRISALRIYFDDAALLEQMVVPP
jgi:ketosteroid isomerase-like protein